MFFCGSVRGEGHNDECLWRSAVRAREANGSAMEVIGDRQLLERNGELSDFVAVLHRAGKNQNDYRLEVVRTMERRAGDRGVLRINYEVIVTNLKTYGSAKYLGGYQHAWVGEFERHLQHP